MSRYNPDHDIGPIFEAASRWRQQALERTGSIFSNESVWSDSNLSSLKHHFVDNPDEGEGTFLDKLERQLRPAPAGVKQLAAEMTWFMLLCPSNISRKNKRETVLTIWNWSGTVLDEQSPWLSDAALAGIGSAGTAFNTHRWRELRFFVGFLEAFRKLPLDQKQRLLNDGWQFAEWLTALPDGDARQLRHMILYLLFPDDFERIFGRSDRRRVLRAFAGLTNARVVAMSPIAVDKELTRIRTEQQQKFSQANLDFYESPLRNLWQPKDEPQPAPPAEEDSQFARLRTLLRREHVLEALQELDRDGYDSQAESTTYDLIHGARRYPPKLALSMAAKHATGKELPRTNFTAGEDSQAFKVLRNLGFSIERKDFLLELVQRFLKQADEDEDLTVMGYPKGYRGLSLNVSFGKGTSARIPWISFTGFGNTTNEGIHPSLLYYRSVAKIVIAYGISETKHAKEVWHLPGDPTTIATYFQQQDLSQPERYGDSYVAKVFDAVAEVDLQGIAGALDEVIGAYCQQFAEHELGVQEAPAPPTSRQSYSVEEALTGLFIDEQQFLAIINLLRTKKNVILQGPPGVGKTFVAKRVGYALMGERAPNRLQMVQFHQSYSYEDFMQGFRPSGQGFRLKNGLFYDFCDSARNDPANKYVFIIDEINRGNLSKVLGEAMMLIEPDKRGLEWAIPLAYSEAIDKRFYVPENVYLIGLMNTADRSLAMVDYALRRRFGFFDLVPQFDSEEFRDYLEEKGAERAFVETVVARMDALNVRIAEDTTNLGPGYRIGHSFFCAIPEGVKPDWPWYRQIIDADIGPLVREYYFDNPKQVETLLADLLRQP